MIAAWLVGALAIYALLGGIFAVWFVTAAVDRFDPAARGAGWGFRVLLFPGAAALWPALLRKWRRQHD